MKKISFTVHGQTLIGTLHFPEKIKPKNPAILFIHGWTSDEIGYYPRAQALTKKGYICLTFSLRGHGESDGKLEDFSRFDHLNDCVAAYDFLCKEEGIDKKRISVVGTSYGGYLAAILTSKREVWKIAMRAPALYSNKKFKIPTVKLIEDREEVFFKNVSLEKNNFVLSAIKKFSGDVLLIESEMDQVIPHAIIQLYAASVKTPKKLLHKVIHNADHQLSRLEWKQTFITYLTNWY